MKDFKLLYKGGNDTTTVVTYREVTKRTNYWTITMTYEQDKLCKVTFSDPRGIDVWEYDKKKKAFGKKGDYYSLGGLLKYYGATLLDRVDCL